MRTVLTLSILSLAFCIGCTKTVSEPNKKEPDEVIAPPDFNQPEPFVEPRFLPDGTPFIPNPESPKETTPPETLPTGATSMVSEPLGKYAAETVPLPPVEDMTAQIDEYITKIGQSLESLDGSPRYEAGAGDIVRDANALALIALGIGLSEADSKYKKSASQIIAATKHLVAAKNLKEGQTAYEALKVSLTSQDAGQPLSWSDKVADLASAMKALPNLSSAAKRVTDTERKLNTTLDRQAQRVLGQLAALAVISQGSIPNVAETTKPDAVEEWKKHCEEFRDAALKVNTAARQYAQDKADGKEPNYAVFSAAYKAMTESCDDCHREFYPKAVGQQ